MFSAISRETARLGQNTGNAITNDKNKNSKDNHIDTNNLLLDIEELKLENEYIKKENESLKRRLKPNTNAYSAPRPNNNQNYDDINGYESVDGIVEEVKFNKNPLERQNSNSRKTNGPANLQTYRTELGIENIKPRNLSLKAVKDVIHEIYQSKEKYDKKCMDNKLPRETMEQHMYNFFNYKYGLKKLTLEWSSSILQGIKKYAMLDNDIA